MRGPRRLQIKRSVRGAQRASDLERRARHHTHTLTPLPPRAPLASRAARHRSGRRRCGRTRKRASGGKKTHSQPAPLHAGVTELPGVRSARCKRKGNGRRRTSRRRRVPQFRRDAPACVRRTPHPVSLTALSPHVHGGMEEELPACARTRKRNKTKRRRRLLSFLVRVLLPLYSFSASPRRPLSARKRNLLTGDPGTSYGDLFCLLPQRPTKIAGGGRSARPPPPLAATGLESGKRETKEPYSSPVANRARDKHTRQGRGK